MRKASNIYHPLGYPSFLLAVVARRASFPEDRHDHPAPAAMASEKNPIPQPTSMTVIPGLT